MIKLQNLVKLTLSIIILDNVIIESYIKENVHIIRNSEDLVGMMVMTYPNVQ